MRLRDTLVLAACSLLAPAASAQETGPNDFRVSNVGPPGTTAVGALNPASAHDPVANRYLVVFEADTTDGQNEIYGQFVTASGTMAGNHFPISSVIATGGTAADALSADIAFNPVAAEFFVVYEADPVAGGTVDNENEIYGQRVSAAGALVGPTIRISLAGTDGDTNRDATDPAVAYNPVTNEYLVTFEADGLLDNKFEVFARRVSALGVVLGTEDTRVSNNGPADNANFDVFDADVAFVPAGTAAPGGYLVVWRADDDTAPQVDNEFEVFAQYLTGLGVATGPDNVRISDMGANGLTTFVPLTPAVACATAGTCLVAWSSDDDTAPQVDNENEVFGQLLSPAGAEVGTNDFRISQAGTNGNANFDASTPAVAFNSTQNNFLVVWEADSDAAPLVDNEFEIFGEFYDTNGMLIGLSDVRLSDMGPNGLTTFSANNPALSYNPVSNEYLVTWYGDDDTPPQVVNENEIWGQRVLGAPIEVASEPGGTRSADRFVLTGPNPFGTRTTFELAVAAPQRVSVEVYNVLGQRVAVLLEETVGAGGAREVEIEAAALPSGSYVVRARGESFARSLLVSLVR